MSVPKVPGDQVSFYSGYTYAQRPVSFTCNQRRYQVKEVLAEWTTPDEKIFRVCTTSAEEFELILKQED